MTTEADDTQTVNPDGKQLYDTVGPRMNRRRMLQLTGTVAGTAALGKAGVDTGVIESPVKEAEAAAPLALLALPAAYPVVTAIAGMAGAMLLMDWLSDDGDLEELRNELAALDDESAAVALAEIARAVAAQETQYLIERENRYNFTVDLDGSNTGVAEYGNSGTVSYLDTAWSEVRAGSGAEFAAGGDAESAEPVAQNRARAVKMSAGVSTLENSNANHESLAYALADQASRDAVDVFRIDNDDTEPAAASGRPAGTEVVAVEYDDADPVVISIPLEPEEDYPDPAGFGDVSDDYEPVVLAVHTSGGDWVTAADIDDLPFEIHEDVNTSNIDTTPRDIYAVHDAALEDTAHPHVGSSFSAVASQLNTAATQLIDTDIPEFVNAAEDQIEEGDLEPEDLIGARELVGRFSDTSNFSRFAAELVGAGFRMPGDGSLGTQATVSHPNLTELSIESLETYALEDAQRPVLTADGETLYVPVSTVDGFDLVKQPREGEQETLVSVETDTGSVATFLSDDESEVLIVTPDSEDDDIFRVNVDDAEVTASSAFDDSVNNSIESVAYDTGRELIYIRDTTADAVLAVDPDTGTTEHSWAMSDIGGRLSYDPGFDAVVVSVNNPAIGVFDASDPDDDGTLIDLTTGDTAHEPTDGNTSAIQAITSRDGYARVLRVSGDDAVIDRIDVSVEDGELDARVEDTEYDFTGGYDRRFAVAGQHDVSFLAFDEDNRALAIDFGAEEVAATYDTTDAMSSARGVSFSGETDEVWIHDADFSERYAAGGEVTGDDVGTGHLFIDSDSEVTIEEGASFSTTQYDTAYLITVEQGDDEHSAVLMNSDDGELHIEEIHIDEDTEQSMDDVEDAVSEEVDEEEGEGLDSDDIPEGADEDEDTDLGDITTDHYIEVPGEDDDLAALSDRGDVIVRVRDVATGEVEEMRPASDIEWITVDDNGKWALPVENAYEDVYLTFDAGFETTEPVAREQDPTDPEDIREQVEAIADAVQDIEEARQDAVDDAEATGGPGVLGVLAGGGVVGLILWFLFGDS